MFGRGRGGGPPRGPLFLFVLVLGPTSGRLWIQRSPGEGLGAAASGTERGLLRAEASLLMAA
jgi:hypothetical protein